MPEINISPGGGGGGESDSSGGGLDIEEMFDQLERMQQKLADNPQLAEMFGVEVPDGTEVSQAMQEAGDTEDVDAEVSDVVDAEFLEDFLLTLEEEGYGDFTIEQVRNFVQNNKEKVDGMIQQQA